MSFVATQDRTGDICKKVKSPTGQRLVVCRNPLLAQEHARRRCELLEATEKELEKIAQDTKRKKRALKGKDKIALRVGKVINKFKVGKHFHVSKGEESFSYQRNEDNIAREKALKLLRVRL